MSVACRSADPRPIINMSCTIRLARSPWERIRSRLLVRSPDMSAMRDRWSSSSFSTLASRTSPSSSSSSSETSAKFFTKFRGFLTSWATPAVSSPKAASFSRTTIWSWARFRSSRAVSNWSFLPCSSSAIFSTRFRRCTSRA